MTALLHRHIEANGIRMHVAEQGQGPLVLLCHGFPESWYSWRHQLAALAAAGFRAVAPDMRGYGGTDRPAAVDQYTMLHLVGDMVGLLDALGEASAVIIGHDWGAPVAWESARLRPDRFRAVVGLSVPPFPRGSQPPTRAMPSTEEALFYMLHFQQPGVAEAELERDPRHSIRSVLYHGSGESRSRPRADGAPRGSASMVPRSGGFLSRHPAPPVLPAWLHEADIEFYAGEFARTGFTGGLNWYRAMDRSWELTAAFANLPIAVPALFLAGELDLVLSFRGVDKLLPNLKVFAPRLRGSVLLRGCGHWTQQERPAEVNEAILSFLRGL